MTSKWKYRISVRAVILSLPYFVFPFVKPRDRLKVGGSGMGFRYRTTFLWKSFTTVLQLVLGWSGQAFYNFRIHGQEIGRRRYLRTAGSRAFAHNSLGAIVCSERNQISTRQNCAEIGPSNARLLSGRLRFRPKYPACRSFQHLASMHRRCLFPLSVV
jgi:hypothetical protein